MQTLAAAVYFISLKTLEQVNKDFCPEDVLPTIAQLLCITEESIIEVGREVLELAKTFSKLYPNLQNLKKFNKFEYKDWFLIYSVIVSKKFMKYQSSCRNFDSPSAANFSSWFLVTSNYVVFQSISGTSCSPFQTFLSAFFCIHNASRFLLFIRYYSHICSLRQILHWFPLFFCEWIDFFDRYFFGVLHFWTWLIWSCCGDGVRWCCCILWVPFWGSRVPCYWFFPLIWDALDTFLLWSCSKLCYSPN